MALEPPSAKQAATIARTQQWVERVVVGLNLCPFAKPVVAHQRLRYVVTEARDEENLAQALADELARLHAASRADLETTLLIHPYVLNDFLAYNDFLDLADAVVAELGYEGEIQIASFHPHYQFADAPADAIENATNRSPFPMLHLLREASIEEAADSGQSAEAIAERNFNTLNRLGAAGLRALLAP